MSMKNIIQIEQHYHFSNKDAQNLRQLRPIMEQYKEQLADKFYNTLLEFEETAKFLPDEQILRQRKETLAAWFIDLFNGVYDRRYLLNIQRIGYTHVKIKLDAHYMNSSMYLVRQFCLDVLGKHFKDPRERLELTRSVEKILDINLDIMSSAYREEELTKVFLSYKLEGKLIRLAERFSYGMNLVLVLALMGISLGIIGLFGYDLWNLFTGRVEHGIIHILGTLLMLWVMIELMDTEIEHLKEGKFSINIFVEVVMVAVIRDILVGTLEHGEPYRQLVLVGTVMVLGLVYWLISHAEIKKRLANK
jgi:uncharacterized membrane protein (DUF373 family)/hemoglobin-like flavoprotein